MTAAHYLACDDHEFFLDIRAHDYRLEKLNDEQRQNVVNSFDTIIESLCQIYGKDAFFRLYIDSEHIAEYRKGTQIPNT